MQEGLLYQTRHLRLRPGVAGELHLHGLPDASLLPNRTTLRLGGEGRQAALCTSLGATTNLPTASARIAPGARFVLYHLTPSVCAAELPAGIPAGFVRGHHEGADCWEGQLAGQRLRILSVACARPLREGGWGPGAARGARRAKSLSLLAVCSTPNTWASKRCPAQISQPWQMPRGAASSWLGCFDFR